MKKLLAILILMSFNAQAANFTDTLGGECARLLDTLYQYEIPNNYKAVEERNSIFMSLQRCLKLYKEVGGNIKTLNETYKYASELHRKDLFDCYLDNNDNKEKQEECVDQAERDFRINISTPKIKLPWYKRIFKN